MAAVTLARRSQFDRDDFDRAIAGMAIITATRDAVARVRSRGSTRRPGQREEGDRVTAAQEQSGPIYHDAQGGGGRAQDPS